MTATHAQPNMKGHTGILVAIEGIDGTGKSTQIRLLSEALRKAGEDPVVSREPTDGYWGQKLRQSSASGRLSLEEELEAFIQDRTEHVANIIQPALDAGKIVLLDRYYFSTIAYQGSRGADIAALKAEMEARFPIPDVVFLLDTDPTVAVRRISDLRGEKPNEFEGLEQLVRVREVFHSLEGPTVTRIDATLSAEAVHRAILESFPHGPLKAKGWWDLSRRLLEAAER